MRGIYYSKVVWETFRYIHKDERIKKSYYNHGFKLFENYKICQKMHFQNSKKEKTSKTGIGVETTDC